jgi:hypothetical protein
MSSSAKPDSMGTDLFNLKRVMVGFSGMPFPYDDVELEPDIIQG